MTSVRRRRALLRSAVLSAACVAVHAQALKPLGFPGVQALGDVSFDVQAGDVHTLVARLIDRLTRGEE